MDQRGCKTIREKGASVFCKILALAFFLFGPASIEILRAQELFPNVEPASTMPKGALGFRMVNETFKDVANRTKYYAGFRLMYGVMKNWTVMTTIGASNHHVRNIPSTFLNYLVNHHSRGYAIPPFILEGVNVYTKYRLFSKDGNQHHLRIAVYAEGAKSFAAHTEGETNLMTENSGYGGGLIFTRLYKRFAASVTWGFQRSLPYVREDQYLQLKFKSGDALTYNVSFGYRIYPKRYMDYKDININLYLETINRSYGAATIEYDNKPYDYEFLKNLAAYNYNGLIANKYSEARISLQAILQSNFRMDMGFAFPLYSRSYLHDYPVVFLSFQHYFYR